MTGSADAPGPAPRRARGRRAAAVVGVLALLVAIAAGVLGAREDGGQSVGGVDVDRVMDRVEELRGLEFKERPRVEAIPGRRLGRILQQVERTVMRRSPERVEQLELTSAAYEALIVLAGLADSAQEARVVERGEAFLGGVYVPERRRVYLVAEVVRSSRDTVETILAHELVHALEDQHFRGFRLSVPTLSDREAALDALHEGSAALADARYAERHLDSSRSAFDIIDAGATRAGLVIPPALEVSGDFPYLDGARFVRALAGRDPGWDLVDRAHRRPPDTTEQVLHPEKYLRRERGRTPRIDVIGVLPGAWDVFAGDEIGELDTLALLRAGVSMAEARRGAAGWDGGAYEIWYVDEPPSVECRAACRRSAAAVVAWRWDTERDAREFAEVAHRYLERGLSGSARRGGSWQVPGGAASVHARGRRSALAIGPERILVDRLARTALSAR